jgi:hypothetical protein
MDLLLIILSMLIGYIVFMASFYLLSKWFFPKIDVTEEEEYAHALEALEAKKIKESRRSKRTGIYRLNKQAA